MTRFDDLFAQNRSLPEQGAFSAETWEAKKKSWTAKQERACVVIRNRLEYNAYKSVKLLATVATILSKIELWFQSTGSAVFISFNREYHELTLVDCTRVMDYAKKLQKAKNKLLKLNSLCKIGEPYFVHKLLSGLSTGYKIFLATFSQTHSLIRRTVVNRVVAIAAVTFDKTVMAAEKEEQQMKYPEKLKSAYIRTGTKTNLD